VICGKLIADHERFDRDLVRGFKNRRQRAADFPGPARESQRGEAIDVGLST